MVDDITRPWFAPGAKRWTSGPDSEWNQRLYRTADGLFVLEKLDYPSYGDGRFVGVSWVEALNWLIHNDHEADANALDAELLRPSDSPSCAGAESVDSTPPPQATATKTVHRFSQGETRTREHRVTYTCDKAYQSFERAMEEDPTLRTDAEVYAHLNKNGCELYDNGMPPFDTWSRYLRHARAAKGEQKNQPRAGRPHGNSIVSIRDTELHRRHRRDVA